MVNMARSSNAHGSREERYAVPEWNAGLSGRCPETDMRSGRSGV